MHADDNAAAGVLHFVFQRADPEEMAARLPRRPPPAVKAQRARHATGFLQKARVALHGVNKNGVVDTLLTGNVMQAGGCIQHARQDLHALPILTEYLPQFFQSAGHPFIVPEFY